MGKNKLKKFAEMATFEHVFQISSEKGSEKEASPIKGNWHSQFFKNSNSIVLELGCGRGEYTIGLAEQFPNKNFIGIDIKGARMWTGARQAQERSLQNVAFVRTNIQDLSSFFEKGEIDEIWITFPDPQMQKRRKRLTSTRFLEQYRSLFKGKGVVHLKTDSQFLFTYTKALAEHNNMIILASVDDLYHSELSSDRQLQIKTYYESQWLARGIAIKYLSFQLSHDNPLQEPDIEILYDTYRSFGREKRSELNMGQ